MDRGHERTEQVINKIEGRLRAEYEQAAQEVEKTLKDYMERSALKDKKWQEWVKDGKRTQDQYDAWRKQQLMQGERWKQLKNQLAEDMVNTTSAARDIVQSYMPEVYEINANYALYQVEVGGGYTLPSSLTLYNREAIARLVKDEPDLMPMGKGILGDIARGKAERWERQKVQSIMMQGILQGKSNVRIAQDIAENLANGDFKASMRYARTMSTNAQNGGRYGAYRRLEANGVPLTLQWEATLDMRTRHEHRMMHGQRRNVNQPFEVDGVEILYPAWLGIGDYKVPPDLVWNCRCTLLAFVKGFEHDALKTSERMEGLSYEDWLNAKERPDPITKQRDIGEMMRMRYIHEYGGDGSGLKKSFADRVHSIIERAKQSPDGITTAVIREAGKEFAKEVNDNYLAPLNNRIKDAEKNLRDSGAAEIEALENERDKLRRILSRGLDPTKHGFASMDDVDRRYDEVDNRISELVMSPKYHKAIRELREAKDAVSDPKKNAMYLRDKIGEVRQVGLGEFKDKEGFLGIKGHLYNSRSPARKIVEQAYDCYPTEWVSRSINSGRMTPKKDRRGYYWDYYKEIAVADYGGGYPNGIHELGHRFEVVIPNIKAQEKEFYEQRTAGEELKWLGSGYKKDEKTRRDNFVNAYMGKDYGGHSYELVSMGFQYAYTDPVELAKDPDMQEWILGMLLTL